MPKKENKSVDSSVNLLEIQAHLTLLGAFDRLKKDVEAHNPERKDLAWVVYVSRAVYRFNEYMCNRESDFHMEKEEHLPPLDVIMVWHAYLLVRFVIYCHILNDLTAFN